MSKRRSLGEALDITPEAAHFISAGKPTVASSSTSPAQPPTNQQQGSSGAANQRFVKVTKPAIESQMQPSTTDDAAQLSQSSPSPRRRRRKKGQGVEAIPSRRKRLVSLTTRIEEATHKALVRAYLENKLNDATQATTQQEIVEYALRAWLTRHGFM